MADDPSDKNRQCMLEAVSGNAADAELLAAEDDQLGAHNGKVSVRVQADTAMSILLMPV